MSSYMRLYADNISLLESFHIHMNSSHSSTIELCEDGNTDPSVSSSHTTKKKQPPPKAIWMITINVKDWNSSNSSSLDNWVRQNCKQSVYQVEKGESGNLHVQLTMTLKRKTALHG